jgi:hypothetical protein
MKNNSNPPKRRRKVGEVIQDIKHKMHAKKGSRKIKRTLKDSASKASSSVNDRRDSREARLRVKSKEKTEAKWVKGRWDKEEKEHLREQGLEGVAKSRPNRLKKSKPTAGARRAKRVLGRMDEQDKRRLRRKVK